MNTIEKLYASVFLLIGAFLVLKNSQAVSTVSSTFGKNLNSVITALQGRGATQ